jgi:hypothetical protein
MDRAAAQTTLEGLFDRIDAINTKDGQASYEELTAVFGEFADQFLEFCDKDSDKKLTKEEFTAGILGNCEEGMSQEDFDAQWGVRMDGVVSAAEANKSSSGGRKNKAFLFVKPHAVTDATKELAREHLTSGGFAILEEGEITGAEIDEKKLVDNHYYAIASKATILKPNELNVPADKFEGQFGLSWQAALDSGRVFNAMDGCAELGMTAADLDAKWGQVKKDGKLIKFGGGFYCGLVDGIEGKEPCYIFNGFFMSMRAKYVAEGCSIYFFVVEWDESAMSWSDFREKSLGPTDPTTAPADSVRGKIYAQWEQLGLPAQPDTGDNGMHGSASPFEGLAELLNWRGATLASEPFGEAMLGAGITEETIKAWSVDPQVEVEAGKKGSLFDAVEDTNASDCLAKLVELNTLNA